MNASRFHVVLAIGDGIETMTMEGVVAQVAPVLVRRIDALVGRYYEEGEYFREEMLSFADDPVGDIPVGGEIVVESDTRPGDTLTIRRFDPADRKSWPGGWDGKTIGLTLKEGEAGR